MANSDKTEADNNPSAQVYTRPNHFRPAKLQDAKKSFSKFQKPRLTKREQRAIELQGRKDKALAEEKRRKVNEKKRKERDEEEREEHKRLKREGKIIAPPKGSQAPLERFMRGLRRETVSRETSTEVESEPGKADDDRLQSEEDASVEKEPVQLAQTETHKDVHCQDQEEAHGKSFDTEETTLSAMIERLQTPPLAAEQMSLEQSSSKEALPSEKALSSANVPAQEELAPTMCADIPESEDIPNEAVTLPVSIATSAELAKPPSQAETVEPWDEDDIIESLLSLKSQSQPNSSSVNTRNSTKPAPFRSGSVGPPQHTLTQRPNSVGATATNRRTPLRQIAADNSRTNSSQPRRGSQMLKPLLKSPAARVEKPTIVAFQQQDFSDDWENFLVSDTQIAREITDEKLKPVVTRCTSLPVTKPSHRRPWQSPAVASSLIDMLPPLSTQDVAFTADDLEELGISTDARRSDVKAPATAVSKSSQRPAPPLFNARPSISQKASRGRSPSIHRLHLNPQCTPPEVLGGRKGPTSPANVSPAVQDRHQMPPPAVPVPTKTCGQGTSHQMSTMQAKGNTQSSVSPRVQIVNAGPIPHGTRVRRMRVPLGASFVQQQQDTQRPDEPAPRRYKRPVDWEDRRSMPPATTPSSRAIRASQRGTLPSLSSGPSVGHGRTLIRPPVPRNPTWEKSVVEGDLDPRWGIMTQDIRDLADDDFC